MGMGMGASFLVHEATASKHIRVGAVETDHRPTDTQPRALTTAHSSAGKRD